MIRSWKQALALLLALLLSGVPSPAAGPRPVRVACVGDSITNGSGANPGMGYPVQLQRMLGPRWLVGNFGVGGATMLRMADRPGTHPYWTTPAFTKAVAFRPDVVIIMLGTNDSYPQNWRFKERFPVDYEVMVRLFSRLPSRPQVFCCYAPPVVGGGQFAAMETAILEQRPMVHLVARMTNSRLIDMHAPLEGNPALQPDHIHPNNQGHLLLALTASRAIAAKELENELLIRNALMARNPWAQLGVGRNGRPGRP